MEHLRWKRISQEARWKFTEEVLHKWGLQSTPMVVRAVHVTASALGSRPPLPPWAPLLLPAVFSLASLLPCSSHSPCLLHEVCPFSLHPSFSQPSPSSGPHVQEMHLPRYMPFGSGSRLQYLTLASGVSGLIGV